MTNKLNFWKGRSVYVTGHTGFKGSWLSLWLQFLGAKVTGFSNKIPTNPSIFESLRLTSQLKNDDRGDINNFQRLATSLARASPSVIFHLAAQPLVNQGYREPIETLSTNIMGTANLLEAVKLTCDPEAVIVITSDKVYRQKDYDKANSYQEKDPLGGLDPYSVSKSCVELIVDSYRTSYEEKKIALATVRAGNVIGGGDWSIDRIIPDCVVALINNRPLSLRYPDAVRPWQHVLEPLSGYLELAYRLVSKHPKLNGYSAYNFGPHHTNEISVKELIAVFFSYWGKTIPIHSVNPLHSETKVLRLDSSKARNELDWAPKLDLIEAVKLTVNWYKNFQLGLDMLLYSNNQLEEYLLNVEQSKSHSH